MIEESSDDPAVMEGDGSELALVEGAALGNGAIQSGDMSELVKVEEREATQGEASALAATHGDQRVRVALNESGSLTPATGRVHQAVAPATAPQLDFAETLMRYIAPSCDEWAMAGLKGGPMAWRYHRRRPRGGQKG